MKKDNQKYVGKFLESDYNNFKDDLLNLLYDYKKKSQRLDTIIKQSDKQQLQLVKINEELDLYKKTLEEKVQIEVSKNRQKDKIMFQQSKEAQMGEMIGMIAHQWRQPLASISNQIISMQLNTIKDKNDLDNEDNITRFLKNQDEKFTKINKHVKLLSNTIDDFKDFFKPTKTKEIIGITYPILKALDIIKDELKYKGITVDINFKTDAEISIFTNEILQVILSIIKNSEDNFLELNAQTKPVIKISTYQENDQLIITIKDNGGGIDSKILPKIFEPYFSTKSEKNGTGIGLYMSKMLIEESNKGKLLVKNTNNGVEFKIILFMSIKI